MKVTAYGMPILLIPLPVRVQSVFLDYLEEHRGDLTANQAGALQRYAENDDTLRILVNTFYLEWDEGGRKIKLEEWVENVIPQIVEVYS